MNLMTRIFGSLFLAIGFIAPMYCVWIFERFFCKDSPLWINTILGLVSVWIFLNVPKRLKWFFGFFVGLMWFYWIGFSFVYFGFAYLVPLIAVVVACIYMVIFALALWSENLYYRGAMLLGLSYIHPFGFDWMVVDSFFAYSYFGVEKYEFTLIILALIFWKKSESKWKVMGALSLLGALSFHSLSAKRVELPFKVNLLESHYSQDFKWQRENATKITQELIAKIEDSIARGYALVVLPETAFPFVLERSFYFQKIKELSQRAVLVIGSMRRGEGGVYNSIYVFKNQEVQIIDKVVLAPFGEKIPLPQWIANYLESIFLGEGGVKILSGEEFKTFEFEGEKMGAVVCYEGTSSRAYENVAKYLIVISNNAWFGKSIESALQKNLMKYYARKHHTTILHASNGSRSFVIFP